jgi:DNA helicase-2/ATP-dependent DNA helicase PcrA
LERIRRIELLNEDTPFRAVSSEASDMDAVRVMTIHGSKGLEFGAVHFPALATGYMPSNRKGTRFPTPPSLPELAVREEHHHAEEECLFFVGLSRAKDYLSLSRAEKYTTRKAGASKYLNSIAGISAAQYLGSGRSYSEASASRLPEIRDSYAERDLDLYMKCPARYRYTAIEGLRGGPAQSAYLRFHSCVYMTVGWLEEERQNGKTATVADALQRLDATWATNGPVGYGLENYYRAAADKMVTGMADIISRETGHYDRQAWTMPVAQREITLTPDRVIIGDDGTVHVQRVLTGRVTISEPDKPIYALLRRGAMQRYPGRQISIEILYLGARECVVVPAGNEDKLIAEYSDAVGAIERGEFHPKPDARRCPNCQCYFVCGA